MPSRGQVECWIFHVLKRVMKHDEIERAGDDVQLTLDDLYPIISGKGGLYEWIHSSQRRKSVRGQLME